MRSRSIIVGFVSVFFALACALGASPPEATGPEAAPEAAPAAAPAAPGVAGRTCLPACLEALMGRCRAADECVATPAPPAPPERVCWGNGVTIAYSYTGGPVASGHTHYAPDDSLCFYAKSRFDMASGRVSWQVAEREGSPVVGELEFAVFAPEGSARARCTGGEWQEVPLNEAICKDVIQRPDGCAPGPCDDPAP